MAKIDFLPKKLDWNTDSLEIKTWSVEQALQPIIKNVTSLVTRSTKTVKRKRKGCSKRARALVMAVKVATANFVEKGKMIAEEIPDARNDILAVVHEVGVCGSNLSITSTEFSDDPCSHVKRSNMVKSAKDLLSAVTRLLILADMVDVHILLGKVNRTQEDLKFIQGTSNQPQLMEGMRRFERSASELSKEAFKRQKELKDPQLRDGMASARAVLIKQSPLLMTSSNVHVRYPDFEIARVNRETIHKQICSAVQTIADIGEGKQSRTLHGGEQNNQSKKCPNLSKLLSQLRDCLENNEGVDINDEKIRKDLKLRVDQIIKQSSSFAMMEETRLERKNKILDICENMKIIMIDKVEAVEGKLDNIRQVVDNLAEKVKRLQKLLQKTSVDQVSDLFINSLSPLNNILSSAQIGKKQDMETSVSAFTKQMDNFINMTNIVCEMTDNDEGKRLVKMSLQQMNDLKVKLENAVKILAKIPESKAAQENVNVFKKSWIEQMKTFMDAVDDVISVQDFLKVCENHILKDVKICCQAMQVKDVKSISEHSRSIYQRSGRLCDVISADMDRFEPGLYTEKVLEAVKVLREEIMPLFTRRVVDALNAFKTNESPDENEFIDSCRLIYDGVRDIRHAFFLTGDVQEDDEDDVNERKPKTLENKPKKELTTIKEAVSKIDNEEIKKDLEKEKNIYWTAVWSNPKVRNLLSSADIGGSQVDGFHEEKDKLDKEVSKWEESNNDIIVLAKYMCGIMTDMTEFIKGRGKIKTTSDVIEAAKKISESGKQLDKLAREIADRCPDSSTKNDLLAYLQRIALYCHQLNITSKVKADVHNVSGELIVSGLDSATSLIQAARNLMNAVVLTVKASYVASRMYKSGGVPGSCPPSPVVVWKMRTPEKQPLVRRDPPEEMRARVRRGNDSHQSSPSKALSLFQERRLSYSTSSSSIGSISSVDKS